MLCQRSFHLLVDDDERRDGMSSKLSVDSKSGSLSNTFMIGIPVTRDAHRSYSVDLVGLIEIVYGLIIAISFRSVSIRK